MDYEQMYNDLKADHVTLQNQFDTFKSDKETEIQGLNDTITNNTNTLSEKEDKIKELNQTNMNLYLRLPQGNTINQTPNEKSFDEILKEIGGSI